MITFRFACSVNLGCKFSAIEVARSKNLVKTWVRDKKKNIYIYEIRVNNSFAMQCKTPAAAVATRVWERVLALQIGSHPRQRTEKNRNIAIVFRQSTNHCVASVSSKSIWTQMEYLIVVWIESQKFPERNGWIATTTTTKRQKKRKPQCERHSPDDWCIFLASNNSLECEIPQFIEYIKSIHSCTRSSEPRHPRSAASFISLSRILLGQYLLNVARVSNTTE